MARRAQRPPAEQAPLAVDASEGVGGPETTAYFQSRSSPWNASAYAGFRRLVNRRSPPGRL